MQKIDLIRIYRRKRALVIDDFPDMRVSIRRMLINFGLEAVDTASTGEEAVQKCAAKHYDIVLSDYNLGEAKNGQQILEELRYQGILRKKSLYLMITAETTRSMVFGALEYQPDDYLTKPFTQTVLQKRLDRLLLEKQELGAVFDAIDAGNHDAAIHACDERIAQGDRYRLKCLRIKAESLYAASRYTEALELYDTLQGERPLEWARIGLGKCLMAMNELDRAETLFTELVDGGSLCLESHDCLADIKNRKGDVVAAQNLLERAAEISPNAILRQQMLARISEENGDLERAEKALRKVLRLADHSCYETPEHFFKLARCIGGQLEHGAARTRVQTAQEVLDRAQRRYRDDTGVALQARLVGAQVLASAGQTEAAQERFDSVCKQLQEDAQAPSSALLELARAHRQRGDDEAAQRVLERLAGRLDNEPGLGAEIDRLSSEPLSPEGKRRAAELNRQGKTLFSQEHYQRAIGLFTEALQHYPNNIALNLNLLLALVKEMSSHGVNASYLHRADQALATVGELAPGHTQSERLKNLHSHVTRLHSQLREETVT